MLSTGKLLSVKRSNVKSCAAEAEDLPRPKTSSTKSWREKSSRRLSLRKGDEVIVQGLTKAPWQQLVTCLFAVFFVFLGGMD